MTAVEIYLKQISERLSSSGSSSNVDITGNSVGLATDANIDTLETILSGLLTIIRNQQTDGTQIAKIRDTAGQELNINPDGSINVAGTITASVPTGLVRESIPLRVESTLQSADNRLFTLQEDFVSQGGLYKKQLTEKMSFCVLRKVENSPSIGDTTYYKGYSDNDYLSNGQPILAGGTFTIERIIEDSNGNVTKSWANANRYVYTLVFDDGSQNYLTYTYA